MPDERAYLVLLLLCLLAGLALYSWRAGKAGFGRAVVLTTAGLALLLGWLLARALYFFARAPLLVPQYGWGHIADLSPAGLAFGGAIAGALLGGWLGARFTHARGDAVLDALTAPALLSLLLARLAEYSVTIGQGNYVENTALQFFPLAVTNEWGEWYYAVFLLEALLALAAFVWALRQEGLRPGDKWQLALLFILLSQVLCESMRAESLKWGFVRVQQVISALGSAAVLLHFLWRARKAGRRRLWPYAGAFLLGVALLIGIEFALDKWMEAPDWALYIAMAGILLGMGYGTVRAARLTSGAA